MGSIFMYNTGTVPYRYRTVLYSITMIVIRITIRITAPVLHEGVYKDYDCIVSLKLSETQKHRSSPSHPHFTGANSIILTTKSANIFFCLKEIYLLRRLR